MEGCKLLGISACEDLLGRCKGMSEYDVNQDASDKFSLREGYFGNSGRVILKWKEVILRKMTNFGRASIAG